MPHTKTTYKEEIKSSEDTPDVVAYRVGELEIAVKEGFKEHNDKLDRIVTNFATKSSLDSVSQRVTSLESDRKWLVRLVIGAVIFATLSLIGVGFKTLGPTGTKPTTSNTTTTDTSTGSTSTTSTKDNQK